MENFDFYEIAKILHIISVISWMAGLLYLPRIFVYHSDVKKNSESDKIFQIMERKLHNYIMTPAMIVTLISGFYMALAIGFSFIWLHIKITLVLFLVIFHFILGKWRQDFIKGQNKHDHKFFRLVNEIPTILMIGIVALVILKPF